MSDTKNANGLRFELSGEQTPRVVIQHVSGDITITGWEETAVAVRSKDEDADLDEILTINQQGNELSLGVDPTGSAMRHKMRHLDADFTRGWEEVRKVMRHFGQGLHVDLEVAVPYTCDLTVRTMSGDVKVRRVQGKVFVETANGDVELKEVEGSVLLKSASGDVKIAGMRGRLGARTASGDVDVREAELAALNLGTASGDIDVAAVLRPADDYEVQSISGDVRLVIPANTRARVDTETLSGDVDCAVPHAVERGGRRQRTLVLNGGGDTRVRVRTTSGDIEIGAGASDAGANTPAEPAAAGEPGGEPAQTRRFSAEQVQEAGSALSGQGEHFRAAAAEAGAADPAPTQRLDAQAAPHKSAEMAILEAIERGEMSVDEGLRRLNELAG